MENVSATKFKSKATGKTYSVEKELMHLLCKGSVNLIRYRVSSINKSILFPYKLVGGKAELLSTRELAEGFPNAWGYLKENRQRLEARERGKWKHDRRYAFGRSPNLSEMEQEKILTPSIAKRTSFTLDLTSKFYFVGSGGGGGGGYGITLKDKYSSLTNSYLLGILNSKLVDWLIRQTSTPFKSGYYAYNRQYIEPLPIRTADLKDPVDIARHAKMVALVDRMLELYNKLADANIPADRDLYERQIEATDQRIDELVYELYGMTEEEMQLWRGR